MDLIDNPPKFDLNDRDWLIYSRNMALAPHYVGHSAKIINSTITEGCSIDGTVEHSVIFGGVDIGRGTVVNDSVIMPGGVIGNNAFIEKAVIGPNAVIKDGAKLGVSPVSENNPHASQYCTHGIVLIEGNAVVAENADIPKESMVKKED